MPGERDRAIRRACERLLAVTPEPVLVGAGPVRPLAHHASFAPAQLRVARPAAPLPVPATPRPGARSPTLPAAPAVADVPVGDVAGPLSRVPALPPRYVVRDELDGLVDAVVGTATGGAVGLTGEPGRRGPARASAGSASRCSPPPLAHRRRASAARFPDGVHWVTVGERPDVLALQLDLLSRLGARPEARTRADATASATDGARTTGACCSSSTTCGPSTTAQDVPRHRAARDGCSTPRATSGVVSRGRGRPAHRVGVLVPAQPPARSPAEVLGVPAATLPAAADRAFEARSGTFALAVALLSAAVRGRRVWGQAEPGRDAGLGGRSWEEIAAELARGADVYGTHPYADDLPGLAASPPPRCPADLRAALLRARRFPARTPPIPVACDRPVLGARPRQPERRR